MPLCGRATARNCSALLGCPRSHLGSCSLEGPPWSRDTLLLEADFLLFFRCGLSCTPSAPGHVCCLHCRLLVPHRGCTTPVLRCARRRDDEGSARFGAALRPRTLSVPSDRPMQRGGGTASVRPCVPGSGAGPPTSTMFDSCPRPRGQSGRLSNGKGSGGAASVLVRVCPRNALVLTEHHCQAPPIQVQ
jgi:hypothetical protein